MMVKRTRKKTNTLNPKTETLFMKIPKRRSHNGTESVKNLSGIWKKRHVNIKIYLKSMSLKMNLNQKRMSELGSIIYGKIMKFWQLHLLKG